jgi:predicted Ser/Thr protein kinase
LRPSTNTRPALWLLERGNRGFVIKDYRGQGFVFRHTVGRFLVWREAKAFRRLRGVRGVPAFYGTEGGLVLIMEAIPGRPVEGLEHEQALSCEFFEKLRNVVRAFHARGIAHCDLKRAPNILLGRNGEPYVVDWSAAITASELRIFPLNLIYRRFLVDDFNAVVKLQLRHAPDDISPQELRRYRSRGRIERIVRRFRDRSRELLQRVA